LVPSIWTVFDSTVWKCERGNLVGCPDWMVVLVNRPIFGGGPYSTTHSRLLKMVGSGERRIIEIEIARAKGKIRLPSGVIRNCAPEPYMPKRLTELFHPSGNSVCYTIQLAHLMGCNPIYLLGFTLQSGTPYFFGRQNPALRRTSFYDEEVPLTWCRWYETQHPGRVRLWPGWDGPIYEVFRTLDEPDQDSGVVPGQERPGQDRDAPTPWLV
jgi:hypothetical protein